MAKKCYIPRDFDIAGVYMIRNKKTGRVYIGSSIDIQERIKVHRASLANHHHENRLMQADFDAGHHFCYSVLRHEIVPRYKGGELKEEIRKWEKGAMKEYNVIENGYNILLVGSGPLSKDRKPKEIIEAELKCVNK